MQKEMPLVQALLQYQGQNRVRFHMPGHKGQAKNAGLCHDLLGDQVFRADVTEIAGLDDLHNPQGVIARAEELAARFFGAAASFFLVNGATAGIEAAMLAYCNPGDKIILPRHVHRAVLNGLILSGAWPVYIQQRYARAGIPLPLAVEEVTRALAEHPRSKLVITVNPTYEGIAADTTRIAAAVQEAKMRLIVDEAHGAHFYLHPAFPAGALHSMADAVIHGTHKTLGSLTQTGMLHLSKPADVARMRSALSLVQSTSPSYVLLASLDAARQQAALAGGQVMDRILALSLYAQGEINRIKGLWCLGAGKNLGEGFSCDPTKLIFGCHSTFTGYQLARMLLEDFGIDVEMATEKYVLAMVTMGDDEQAVEYLLHSLRELSRRCAFEEAQDDGNELRPANPLPAVVMSPREAFFAPNKEIMLQEAGGEVSAETLIPYPPGVPLISLGERFDEHIIEEINRLKQGKVHWQGPADGELLKVKVVNK